MAEVLDEIVRRLGDLGTKAPRSQDVDSRQDGRAGSVSRRGIRSSREACRHGVPVLTLGGVTVANARLCTKAGAAGVAEIRLFQNGDIRETVAKLKG